MFNRILSGDYPRSRALSALLVLIGVCLALGPFGAEVPGQGLRALRSGAPVPWALEPWALGSGPWVLRAFGSCLRTRAP